MAIVKKFATLLLCLGILAWQVPVAASALSSPAVAANSAHCVSAGSHSAWGTTQVSNSGCGGDRHGGLGGACSGCAHACSVTVPMRHAPSFLITADMAHASSVSLVPIGAFPPPLPPPRA